MYKQPLQHLLVELFLLFSFSLLESLMLTDSDQLLVGSGAAWTKLLSKSSEQARLPATSPACLISGIDRHHESASSTAYAHWRSLWEERMEI